MEATVPAISEYDHGMVTMVMEDPKQITATQFKARCLRLLDEELAAYQFCTEDQAAHLLRPHVWRRTQAALQALRTGRVCYLQDGQPVGTTADQRSG